MKRILLLVGMALFLLAGCGGDDDNNPVEQGTPSPTAPANPDPGAQNPVDPGSDTQNPGTQDPGTQDPGTQDPGDPVLRELTITPESASLRPSESIQFKAVGVHLDASGKVLKEVDLTDRVVWSSSKPDIADFSFEFASKKGELFAHDLGSVTVTGTFEGEFEGKVVKFSKEVKVDVVEPEFAGKDIPDPPEMPDFPER